MKSNKVVKGKKFNVLPLFSFPSLLVSALVPEWPLVLIAALMNEGRLCIYEGGNF